jgi:hypothetical protein
LSTHVHKSTTTHNPGTVGFNRLESKDGLRCDFPFQSEHARSRAVSVHQKVHHDGCLLRVREGFRAVVRIVHAAIGFIPRIHSTDTKLVAAVVRVEGLSDGQRFAREQLDFEPLFVAVTTARQLEAVDRVLRVPVVRAFDVAKVGGMCRFWFFDDVHAPFKSK